MNMLTKWIQDAQEINIAEKGVSYSEEAFTQLYEEALKLNADHKIELNFATGRGALMGAAGVGLVWASVAGIKKFRKNKSKVNKEIIEKSFSEALKPENMDVIEVTKNGKVVKRVSKKDKDALAAVINEITENEKGK